MISLGSETGQKTPPNSPATPIESVTVAESESRSKIQNNSETSPISNRDTLVASPAACNGGMGDVAQELHNLQLIKQQMITNEFVRATGYNQDQAVRILNHFKWDYQAAVSDFFDEVRVIKENSQQQTSVAFPPHNTPLTPPAFPSEMTLSFNHLLQDSTNNNIQMGGPFSAHSQQQQQHSQMPFPITDQLNVSSSSSNNSQTNNHFNCNNSFNNSYEFHASNFSPLGGASSPVQYQRTASSSSFQSQIPFPMETGSGLNSSACSTPSSTGSFAASNGGRSPFTFHAQLGSPGPAFGGCQQQQQLSAVSNQFMTGGLWGNQMDYRCGGGIKTSDSLESME
ncbi:uncharacterized protein LOC134855188 isoform X2 [Symsagittifera roscoffensis]|uniref:uncharacterized protein LOC134855188 isoform X2 n=1 Tax=Symsagittifera roscoffensis TaxID=84072 RepID=UPI00307BF5DE